ncbi:hypothetical protein F4677DRAFT_407476 [Hypoxylon crocopeplum]|nr:hypothetical protein F4677DRAFT_407476 [Hypoxylon crocopeplum]
MEQPIKPQARALPKPSKMNYACEACRTSKVKCQSGPQPGICKRCSEFKRECVFRTGPRTRRPKISRPDAPVLPPPPGPSKTFSIDFTVPADEDMRDNLDDLREKHERFIEDLVPSSDDEDEDDIAMMSPAAAGAQTFSFNDLSMPTPSLTTSSSASANSRPVSSLGIKPQFNLDSAAKLLDSFRSMLPCCPCIVLPDDADVRSMARDMPFVLLAILAVTSCSTSLQGNSLYDEEFRKILGLKFVTGGERSVELLQGLMIYCSWYPFHVRPKNRQLLQYLRMAVDIVHDLELDEEVDMNLISLPPERRARKLESIRAYLVCFYNVSVHSWAWCKPCSLKYTSWMAKCCDTLEQYSELEQDHTLAWLVRLQYIITELEEIYRNARKPDGGGQSEHHRKLIRMGLETELRDFQTRIPSHLSTTPSILMASFTADAYLLAAPLMQAPRPRLEDAATPLVSAPKLQAATYTARAFFDYATGLAPARVGCFCGADVSRFIMMVILAYRLSFPMPACPEYDYIQGRKVLDFGTHLAALSSIDDDYDDNSNGGAGGSSGVSDAADNKTAEKGGKRRVDVATALRVILGSVKNKFEKKSVELEAAVAEENSKRARLCPMFDGSLDQYLPLWEGQQGPSNFASSAYATSSSHGGSSVAMPATSVLPADGLLLQGLAEAPSKPMLFHDLWATMTMGWATDGDGNLQQQQQGTGMAEVGGVGDEYAHFVGL